MRLSIRAFISKIRKENDRGAKNIYIDSTNADFLSFFLAMKVALPHGTWVFDIHDDLRYDATGFKKIKKAQLYYSLHTF